MKNLLILFAVLLSAIHTSGQEFKTYDNGLIYSENAVKQLRHIVDSLNLRYKVCDMNKVFYSKSQTVATIVSIKGSEARKAKKDMDANMPIADLLSKYPDANVQKDILVVKDRYENYEGDVVVEFSDVTVDYGFEITQKDNNDFYHKDLKGKWLYEYNAETKYSKESIAAFYFPHAFKSIPLDLKYCRQIGYADCLVDTISGKLKKNAKKGYAGLPENWEDSSLEARVRFLDKLRSVKVVGGCSMDNSPRYHAVHIALVSASTANWAVFLKAHLDIMNDRFERMSDGSYAWAARQTYIKELEVMDINVPDLLMGISLRAENVAENHYFGSIGRLGRAIAESKDRGVFEQQMLSMMGDTALDDYNRLLSYYLFVNYNYNIGDDSLKQANDAKLMLAANKLPSYLLQRIRKDGEK